MKLLNEIKEKITWQRIKSQDNKKIYEEWLKNGKPIPPPHAAKQEIIKKYQRQFKVSTLIETGTFRGEMVYALKDHFNKIVSIELSKELYSTAKERFKKYSHIEIMQGDSGSVLKNLVPLLKSNAIFWLDGHYSGFETAKGDYETPIWEELKTILKSDKTHIILIDDARLFTGSNDYPTSDELKKFLLTEKNGYNFAVEDDVIRFFP